jgi:hypothetical protein
MPDLHGRQDDGVEEANWREASGGREASDREKKGASACAESRSRMCGVGTGGGGGCFFCDGRELGLWRIKICIYI